LNALRLTADRLIVKQSEAECFQFAYPQAFSAAAAGIAAPGGMDAGENLV
jgi:hypothetical protein